MSDYLSELLSRSFGPVEPIHPRLPSEFEPSPYVDVDLEAAPPVAEPRPAEASPPPPREPVARPSVQASASTMPPLAAEARGAAARVEAKAPEGATRPPAASPGALDTIVPDPTFGKTKASRTLAPATREDPAPRADRPPITRAPTPPSDPAAQFDPAPPAEAAARIDRPATDPAPRAEVRARIDRPVTPEHPARADPAIRQLRLGAGAETASEAPRARPETSAGPMVQIETRRRRSAPAPEQVGRGPALVPAVSPAVPLMAAPAPSAPSEALAVKVHIDRIEVRAAAPAPKAAPPARPGLRRPTLSLAEYLERRSGTAR